MKTAPDQPLEASFRHVTYPAMSFGIVAPVTPG